MNRRLFLASLAHAALVPASSFAAAFRGPPPFTLFWSPKTRDLVLIFSNRCTSGSLRYAGHDIVAEIQDDTLTVTGGFRFEGGGWIGPTDCMNVQSEKLVIPHVPPGRYRIVQNGADWADVTLGRFPFRQRFDPQLANLPPGRAPRPWFGPGRFSG